MKKIIVLGMFFVSYVSSLFSAEENPAFALIVTGIAFISLKIGTDRLQKYSDTQFDFISSSKSSYAVQPSVIHKTKYQETMDDDTSLGLPTDESILSDSFSKKLKGLRDAKRDKIHIPHTHTPSSIVDVDEVHQTPVSNIIETKIPFLKKTKTMCVQQALRAAIYTRLPVDRTDIFQEIDDYHHITSLALSPRFDDREDEEYVVVKNR